jgi:ubiquinone/menaquinone biosynthesis C-methylase UbiE
VIDENGDTLVSTEEEVKNFYINYHDEIYSKRHGSKYWLRSYTHNQIHRQFLEHIRPGLRILDAGSGEGILSSLIAMEGCEVIATDISNPNLRAFTNYMNNSKIYVSVCQSDVENLPFSDNSFDIVVSSHVLEHLPNLEKGLNELYRVTRSMALIAMPTCLNPSCWVLLGGDNYWKLGRRSFYALPFGFVKMLFSALKGEEGPDEGYVTGENMPHIWRFPWEMRKRIMQAGFLLEKFEAGPIIFPYISEYFPKFRELQKKIDRYKSSPILNQFGYGSFAVCRKEQLESY